MRNGNQEVNRKTLYYIILSVLSFVFTFPTLFMMINSIKENENQIIADMDSIMGFVPYGELGFQNYIDVFQRMDFFRYYFNSVVVTGSIVVIGLIVNSMIAFCLARQEFKGKKFMLILIIALMIIPRESLVIPLLMIMNKLDLLETRIVLILPFIADPLYIFLFYQFFRDLPKSIEESATLDGASLFRIYREIALPLSKPIIVTVTILASIAYWGEFLWPVMSIRTEKYRTLPLAMQYLFTQNPKQWGDIFAFATLITLPLLIVFIIFQRHFVKSIANTGIKE